MTQFEPEVYRVQNAIVGICAHDSPRAISGHKRIVNLSLLFATFALALMVRLAPLSRSGIDWAMEPDSYGYVRLAEGLATDCGFAQRVSGKCQSFELERTPGYPLFLAAMPSLRMALVVQAIAAVCISFLVASFCWSQWGLRAALTTAMLISVDVPSTAASASIMSETLFTSLVTLTVFLQLTVMKNTEGDWQMLMAQLVIGVLIALAILVRPIGEILLVVGSLATILFYRTSSPMRLALTLILLCIPIVVILGWSFRNYQRRGVWIYSSIASVNLYYYRAAGVLAYESGRAFEDIKSDLLISTGGWNADPLILRERGRRIIIDHPWATAFVSFKGLLHNCFGADWTHPSVWLSDPAQPRDERRIRASTLVVSSSRWLSVFVQLALTAFTWTGVLFALWRLRRCAHSEVGLILVPLSVALALLLAAAGPEGYCRFRVPAVPLLAMVAAFGWAAAPRRIV